MNNIELKSIATLIDELVSTNIKCWFAQEAVMTEKDSEKIAQAAKLAQEANARRNALIRAIDSRLGEKNSQLPKTYA